MRLFRKPAVPPVPEDPIGMHLYAVETLDLAESNWVNVGNPFRFREWRRVHKIVQARNDALDKALDAAEGKRAG